MIGADPSIVAPIGKRRVGHGLVFGKFMPPTNGHLYLIDFARACCETLTLVVCSLPDEPIPGALRFQWLKEIFPQCDIVHLEDVMPQEPAHPQDRPFFQLWADALQKCCPGRRFEVLFASESYGYKMADVMKIKFIPVDTGRGMVNVSGTRVRENPFLYWDYLHPVVRPYFLKRIAVVGPPGAEKTSLVQKLAEYFGTAYVASFADTLIKDLSQNIPGFMPGQFTGADAATIVRGQIASEEALARQSRCVMFTEADAGSVAAWAREALGTCPLWVEQEAQKRAYDLYLNIGGDEFRHELPEKNLFAVEGRDLQEKFEKSIEVIFKRFPLLRESIVQGSGVVWRGSRS